MKPQPSPTQQESAFLQAARDQLAAWPLAPTHICPITAGHINQTWLVETKGPRFILQRLNAIFSAEVNLDLEAITLELAAAGLATPQLVSTREGALWHSDEHGGIWRVLTYLPGLTIDRVDSPARGCAAGRLLGRFHHALWDCTYPFRHQRVGVHDTEQHLTRLEQALVDQRTHRLFGQAEPLAQAILQAAAGLELFAELPERVVHGDPKITNILFDETGEALALLDLDTLARMPLPVELGDALRSWCCPQGEEEEGPLDLELFRAALGGYAEALGDRATRPERQRIAGAVEIIALELAARFCADVLHESYFGWDRRRFSSAGEHNLRRTRAQLSLARSVRALLPEMERIVGQAWRG